jgi:hypothetical protein
MLAECLRKVWTVIPLRKIQRAWEDTGILAEEQHGFRPGRTKYRICDYADPQSRIIST